MDTHDYFVEDLILNLEKTEKKKMNSGRKGKSGERHIVNILNERFDKILSNNTTWGKFSRSVGSGNRWGQACLSNVAKNFYSGDVICENFKFVIESKSGYDEVDLFSAFSGSKDIDDFLKQVTDDSKRSGKMPMLIWKKTRKKPLVFITEPIDENKFNYIMYYKEWKIVLFDELLNNMPDEFFFEIK